MGRRTTLRMLRTGNLAIERHNRRLSGSPRRLLKRPVPGRGGWSPRRLNALLSGLGGARTYLEIGVREGFTLESVKAKERVGVDPFPMFDVAHLPRDVRFFEMTSDDYFAQVSAETSFDVVFLDGLHTFAQTYVDLVNALAHVPDGAILVDDTVPSDAASAIPDMEASIARRRELGLEGNAWHGSVWKLVPQLEEHHPELDFRTIVDSGNPQTLVWRRVAGREADPPSGGPIDASSALTYERCFATGVPASFRPTSERRAIEECLMAIRPARQ